MTVRRGNPPDSVARTLSITLNLVKIRSQQFQQRLCLRLDSGKAADENYTEIQATKSNDELTPIREFGYFYSKSFQPLLDLLHS